MSNTTFVNQSTVIVADWLNDVNDVVYDVLGDGTNVPATKAQARDNLGLEIGVDIPSNTGTGASGTWPINISGNAATASGISGTVAIANGGTGQTTASAAFNALKQTATTVDTGVVELATATEFNTGTDSARIPSVQVIRENQLVFGTPVSASSTSVDFTGIPSWVNRITILFSSISTNGTAAVRVQIGDSGGIENTGYNASGQNSNNAPVAFTDAFPVEAGGAAADSRDGSVVIERVTGNTWVARAFISKAASPTFGGGGKTLSAALDRVRITADGVNTFDAGTFNITYG